MKEKKNCENCLCACTCVCVRERDWVCPYNIQFIYYISVLNNRCLVFWMLLESGLFSLRSFSHLSPEILMVWEPQTFYRWCGTCWTRRWSGWPLLFSPLGPFNTCCCLYYLCVQETHCLSFVYILQVGNLSHFVGWAHWIVHLRFTLATSPKNRHLLSSYYMCGLGSQTP